MLHMFRRFVPFTLIALALTLDSQASFDPERVHGIVHPYLEDPYEPSPTRILARWSGGDISERDLYLFLLMLGHDNPDLFRDYLDSKRERNRAARSRLVEDALRNYVRIIELAPEGASELPVVGARQQLERYWIAPITELVWIDKTLRPMMRIDPADRAYYYYRNQQVYATNASVQARLIFRAVEDQPTLEADNAAREMMERLRSIIITEQAEFEELAREYSQSPSAVEGGLLPPMEKGRFDFRLEQALFNLRPGEISEVVKGPGGYYLFQCVRTIPFIQKSMVDVESELDEVLEPLALQGLHRLRFRQFARLRSTVFEPQRIFRRPLDDVFIYVGRARITIRQFMSMFPDLYNSPVSIDEDFGETVLRLHDGELVTERVIKRRLMDEPRVLQASDLADSIIRANNAYLEMRRSISPVVTEEEAREFHARNAELFSTPRQYRVFAVAGEPTTVGGMSPQEFVTRGSDFAGEMERFVSTLRPKTQQYVADRAAWEAERLELLQANDLAVAMHELPASPTATLAYFREMLRVPPFMQQFDRHDNSEFEYTVEDLGFVTTRDSVFGRVAGRRAGEFSAVYPLGVRFVAYYVDRVIEPSLRPYDDVRMDARAAVIETRFLKAVEAKVRELDKRYPIEFLFDPDISLTASE